MSMLLTGFVSVIYVGIALAHVSDARYGLGLAFASYALANVGLIMAEAGK